MTKQTFKISDTERFRECTDKIMQLNNELRAQNVLVIANQADCQSCSLAIVAERMEKDSTKTEFMFYHHQDWEDFEDVGRMYLGYGSTSFEEDSDENLGRLICNTAGKLEIPVVWDGNAENRIQLVFQY